MDAINSNVDVQSTEYLNYRVLQKYDPYLESIKFKSSHAVLYKFDPDEAKWEKLPCQGVFFIYSRNEPSTNRYEQQQHNNINLKGPSKYAISILNRFSLKNFMLALDYSTDIEQMDEFLMIRTPAGVVDNWGSADSLGEEPNQSFKEKSNQPDIWGVWIYVEEDRITVESLCKELSNASNDLIGNLFKNAIKAYKSRTPVNPGAYH